MGRQTDRQAVGRQVGGRSGWQAGRGGEQADLRSQCAGPWGTLHGFVLYTQVAPNGISVDPWMSFGMIEG